jgi:hypothetical protein
MALEAAVCEGRASSADMAKACGAKTGLAFRVAASKGRKALREAMADPRRRESLCTLLQAVAEAEEGERRQGESLSRLMREPAPKGPQADRMARQAVLAGSPSDAQARRMARVYVERSQGSYLLERLTTDLRAARIAAEKVAALPVGDAGLAAEKAERLRRRIKGIAQAYRQERQRIALVA